MMRGSTTTSRRAAVAPAARNSVSHATEAIISIRQAHGFMAKNHTGLLMYRAMRQLRLLKVMTLKSQATARLDRQILSTTY